MACGDPPGDDPAPIVADECHVVTAGGVAAYAASRMGSGGDTGGLMRVMFFGSFALMNYQALQAHHDHYLANGPDDADWWKR